MCNWIASLSGIAEKELNWRSCTCLYPESLLLSLPPPPRTPRPPLPPTPLPLPRPLFLLALSLRGAPRGDSAGGSAESFFPRPSPPRRAAHSGVIPHRDY